ncbi:MAG TPA: response regulator transcription factor [Planctomycetaceae bacterium]|jgi:two-component system NarL family response regulator
MTNDIAAARTSTFLKAAILDQQRVFADALIYRLQNEVDIKVVCSAANSPQAAAAIVESRPHLVVLDAELSGGRAFDVATEIRSQLAEVRLLFLTQSASDTLIDQALRLNADGILSRDEPLQQLIAGIRRAANGEKVFSRAINARIDFDQSRRKFHLRVDPASRKLTDRQLEILRYLARGDTVKSVAHKLLVSPKSIDNQKLQIMSKLGVRDKVRLALYAVREGLITP